MSNISRVQQRPVVNITKSQPAPVKTRVSVRQDVFEASKKGTGTTPGTYGYKPTVLSGPPPEAAGFKYLNDFAAKNPGGTWTQYDNGKGSTFYRYEVTNPTTGQLDYRETSVMRSPLGSVEQEQKLAVLLQDRVFADYGDQIPTQQQFSASAADFAWELACSPDTRADLIAQASPEQLGFEPSQYAEEEVDAFVLQFAQDIVQANQ